MHELNQNDVKLGSVDRKVGRAVACYGGSGGWRSKNWGWEEGWNRYSSGQPAHCAHVMIHREMPAGAPKLRFLVPKFAHQEELECLPTSYLAHFNEANIPIRILCLHYFINTNTQTLGSCDRTQFRDVVKKCVYDLLWP